MTARFARHTKPIWGDDRYAVLYGGRGGVKSWTAARYCLIRGTKERLRILCAREVQKSIRESVHQLLRDQITLLGLEGFYQILNTEIRGINGTQFVFTGLSELTADTIKSYEGIDVCWLEEAQALSDRSLDILIPTIRKEGSKIILTFNPELDTDPVWTRFVEHKPDDAVLIECSYHNNPWFPRVLEKERQDFLRQVEKGARRQAEYDNIWEGKCKPAVEGAIYPDEIEQVLKEDRLMEVKYDPRLKAHTIWDLGWGDKMAICVVQVSASQLRFIDYIEDSHRTYEYYVNLLKSKPYANQLSKAWLPHDGHHKNPQTGISPIQLVGQLGLDPDTKGVPNIPVTQGIEAARQMFPRCYFDKANCTSLFNRLRRYARVVNSEGVATIPKKDENTHGADAFRYVAVVENQLTNEDEDFAPIKYDSRGIV